MFKYYDVHLKFRNEFAAGIPRNPESLLAFLEARAPEKPPENATPLDELAGQIEGEVLHPEVSGEAAITTTFKQQGGHLVYESRGVRSHIKDCASVLGQNLIKDPKALKARVANRVHVEPQFIPLTRSNGAFIDKVDGSQIRAVSSMTPRGMRTAVKIVEYLNAPEMRFTLMVLDDKVVGLDLLKAIFTYGGTIKGMGQDRSLEWGRYNFTIEERTVAP